MGEQGVFRGEIQADPGGGGGYKQTKSRQRSYATSYEQGPKADATAEVQG